MVMPLRTFEEDLYIPAKMIFFNIRVALLALHIKLKY